MRIAAIVGGLVLALAGSVWLLQGLNSTLVPRSFMTGSGLWVVLGAATFAIGLWLAWRAWRH